MKNLIPEERYYCQKCSELFSITENNLHIDHNEMVEGNINDFKLSHPSQVKII